MPDEVLTFDHASDGSGPSLQVGPAAPSYGLIEYVYPAPPLEALRASASPATAFAPVHREALG